LAALSDGHLTHKLDSSGIEAVNALLEKMGLPVISEDDANRVRHAILLQKNTEKENSLFSKSAMVLALFEQSEGNILKVAEECGCTPFSLLRIVFKARNFKLPLPAVLLKEGISKRLTAEDAAVVQQVREVFYWQSVF
jgi:hypothetical protein